MKLKFSTRALAGVLTIGMVNCSDSNDSDPNPGVDPGQRT